MNTTMQKIRLYSMELKLPTVASLSIALGILACNQGYRVRFYSAPMLANELVEAKENHTLVRLEKQLAKTDLRPLVPQLLEAAI